MSQRYTIVDFFSDHQGYSCGYCKQETTCFSRGLYSWSIITWFKNLKKNWCKFIVKTTVFEILTTVVKLFILC